MATSSSADSLFERFLLWPLDGVPIPNNRCIASIDYIQYCSLEQFAVFCGFFSNLVLELETDGQELLAAQAEEFRQQGMNLQCFYKDLRAIVNFLYSKQF